MVIVSRHHRWEGSKVSFKFLLLKTPCRYCGSVPPPSLTSSSSVLTIYFSADESITTDGFVVSYTTTNASTGFKTTSHISDFKYFKNFSVCGERITNNEGYIISLQYPDNYLPDRTCVWVIQTSPLMQIRVILFG